MRFSLMPFVVLLLFFLTPFLVTAATISGNIYDFSFELVENTIVEINTEPRQIMVAKDGYYSFNVPIGTYVISARWNDLVSEDEIIVSHDGEFRYDVILLPSFDDELDLDYFDEIEQDLKEFDFETLDKTKEYLSYLFFGIITILIYLFIFITRKNRKKLFLTLTSLFKKKSMSHDVQNNYDDDLSKILEFLKTENGRSTQKEIRKNIPLSEAKISLLLSELEHNGTIKRFKKGRSKIVVLK